MFSCLKFKKLPILFAIIRTNDLCCLHFEKLAIVKNIWQKRGGVFAEGNHCTRHPNMLVHLVTLGLILIIKLIKV